MRYLLLHAAMLFSLGASAQLRAPVTAPLSQFAADAGAKLPNLQASIHSNLLGTRDPARDVMAFASPVSQPAPFAYGNAKPYLAFFCRLELDIEEATKFPVRFRLGEVRGWQQELRKRD